MYVDQVICQLKYSVKSVLQLMEQLKEEDLSFRPILHKKSIGELLQHICELIEADLFISKGSSYEEMEKHYQSVKCISIEEMRYLLKDGLTKLESTYMDLNEDELNHKNTSYWGVNYTRFEWLLEILVHFTHHRAQLHMLMVQKFGDINISLFE